jgi:bifunctional pyridoxal-dependent enzyme with beta-cystathionase and maltose regulon repressor activities
MMFDELRTEIKTKAPTLSCNFHYILIFLVTKFPETLVDADFTYGEGPGGSSRLRGHLKEFINSYFNIPSTQLIDKEHIVTTPGVYLAMEQILWVVANPGDGILVGKPYYGGFIQGFTKGRSKYTFSTLLDQKPEFNGSLCRVKIVGVEFKDIDPFSIEAVKVYRDAFERSNEDGTPITAILLCNPNNPLGRCFVSSLFHIEVRIHPDKQLCSQKTC